MADKCETCSPIDHDVAAVVRRLMELKRSRWVGHMELRLDGSGFVDSMRSLRYEKIPRRADSTPFAGSRALR